MPDPSLTTFYLLQHGFVEVGCWELTSDGLLSNSVELPRYAGVYAFAIDGVVRYVGLASKSLRQRLNFYRSPGSSQRTNVRLNEIIRGQLGSGASVEILVAQPPDYEWNGLKISGAEGLEAGLISMFDLPWNMRGSSGPVVSGASAASARTKRDGTGSSRILDLVSRRPGMTELELAKALHGPSAVQQQVNQDCRRLVGKGLLVREGSGGRNDPFTYHLPKVPD